MITQNDLELLEKELREELSIPEDLEISNYYLCELLSNSISKAQTANLNNKYKARNTKKFASAEYLKELEEKFNNIKL